jgi:hypothetical protein
MDLIVQIAVLDGREEIASFKQAPNLQMCQIDARNEFWGIVILTMTPTDQMSIFESHSIPEMISGARKTPGMTSPECFCPGSPKRAAPKSVITGGL